MAKMLDPVCRDGVAPPSPFEARLLDIGACGGSDWRSMAFLDDARSCSTLVDARHASTESQIRPPPSGESCGGGVLR